MPGTKRQQQAARRAQRAESAPTPTVTRVVGYTRVSTDEQSANGHGLDSQRAAIETEVEHRGWRLVEWLQDSASGKSLDRPKVQRALELLRRGDADVLVVSKLDRLSRSLSDFAQVMETARSERWSLVALDMNVDMTTETGEAMAGVLAVFAQWERRRLSRRTSEGLAAARAKGVKLGAPRAVPDDVAERAGGLRADGVTFRGIADRFNDEGVPTARGGRWYPASVSRLLSRTAGT